MLGNVLFRRCVREMVFDECVNVDLSNHHFKGYVHDQFYWSTRNVLRTKPSVPVTRALLEGPQGTNVPSLIMSVPEILYKTSFLFRGGKIIKDYTFCPTRASHPV